MDEKKRMLNNAGIINEAYVNESTHINPNSIKIIGINVRIKLTPEQWGFDPLDVGSDRDADLLNGYVEDELKVSNSSTQFIKNMDKYKNKFKDDWIDVSRTIKVISNVINTQMEKNWRR